MTLKTPLSQLSDEALIQHFQTSDSTEIMGILFRRHQDFIRRTCQKYLRDAQASEDALMDIFLALNSTLKQYQIQHFKSWLFFVARNHCYKLLRQHPFICSIDGIQEDLPAPGRDTEVSVGPTPVQLSQAIQHLKEQQRTCIELFYFQGFSYAEIARQVNIDLKQVKSHIQNGKLRLRKLITTAA